MAGSSFAARRDAAIQQVAATHIQSYARGKLARQSLAGDDSAAVVDPPQSMLGTAMHATVEAACATDQVASFLVLDEDERAQLEIGHISEMPKILLSIMSRHRATINSLFRTLDTNQDGLIRPNEFIHVLSGLGFVVPHEGDFDLLFKAIDTDGQGTVTFEEIEAFCRAVRRGKQLLEPEPEEERRKRLGLDEEDRIKAANAAAAERQRQEREEAAGRAAAMHAEMLAQQRRHAAAEMADWMARSDEDNARRYAEMLAAARAMLPGGANSLLGGGADAMAAKHRPPPKQWKSYPMPRVERTGFKPMAWRAAPHHLHASVAFPRTSEISSNAWRESTGLARSASAASVGWRDAPTRPTLTRNSSAGPAWRPGATSITPASRRRAGKG